MLDLFKKETERLKVYEGYYKRDCWDCEHEKGKSSFCDRCNNYKFGGDMENHSRNTGLFDWEKNYRG